MRKDALAKGFCCHGTNIGAFKGRAILLPTAVGTLLICRPERCDIAMSMAAQSQLRQLFADQLTNATKTQDANRTLTCS